jgi:hypothetical protein
VTGLALLAFLGAGYTPQSREVWDGIRVGDVVRKALQYLMDKQDPEGCIGGRTTSEYMYNHLIAALALSEAYGLTQSDRFRSAAQKAVDFTVAAQNPGRGWRYRYQAGENDSSCTGWAVMVLKSAEMSGLSFDRRAYDGAMAWFESVLFQARAAGGTGGSVYKAGYQTAEDAPVFIPGINDQYDQHPSMTAIWIMSEVFITHNRSSRLLSGAQAILADPPQWDNPPNLDKRVDFYYWYYAALAMYQIDGPNGEMWKRWNRHLVPALVNSQNRADGQCRRGSWEPVDRWSCRGGRVYATAINTLTMEVYYRYQSVFGTD